MSMDPITPIIGAASSLFGGGGSIKAPKYPDPPAPPEPTEMPDPDDLLKKKQKQKSAALSVQSGRASTILSEAAGRSDRLGG